jgi:hypothetical protein
VTPSIGADARASLSIQPEIEYGPRIHRKVPSPDLSGWQVRNERDSRSFPELRMDVEVQSGEFLLIGPIIGTGETLGQKLFLREAAGKRRQVVLLVRVLRPTRDELFDQGYSFDDFLHLELPENQQATRTPARETALLGATPPQSPKTATGK